MTETEFHARRIELSNALAAAGAALLDHMVGAAGAVAAIPNTESQQYAAVGEARSIRALMADDEEIQPARRMRKGDRPELDLYWGKDAGQPRRFAALITNAGHGILQEYGSRFEHAQPGQEVLEVMEILPGQQVGASTVLTDERITEIEKGMLDHWASMNCVSSVALIAFARAIEREVAAQAGQVAVPEGQAAEIARLRAELEKMWKARFMLSQALHNTMVGNQSAWIEWQRGAGAEAAMAWIHNGLVGPGLIPDGKEAQPWYDANQDDRYDVPPCPALAAAPSAPAVVQQAPAAEVPLWDENGEPWNLAAEQVEYERAQASTPDVRSQEGGAA